MEIKNHSHNLFFPNWACAIRLPATSFDSDLKINTTSAVINKDAAVCWSFLGLSFDVHFDVDHKCRIYSP